jgi:hypothetical protein
MLYGFGSKRGVLERLADELVTEGDLIMFDCRDPVVCVCV